MKRLGGSIFMYDLLIKDGMIVDGTGKMPYCGDVAVKDGKIAECGGSIPAEACRPGGLIRADGRYVSPGFIDIHCHADSVIFRHPDFPAQKLHQGLTTIINGNCGLSIVPAGGPYESEIRKFLEPVTGSVPKDLPISSYKEYCDAVKELNLPIHTGMLIGNGTICASVCGYGAGQPGSEEIKKMHAALEDALAGGAPGVSLGLGYAPECHYTTETLIQLLEPMRGAGVPLITHIRGEGDSIHKALREVVSIAGALGVPLHVSHLKTMGKRNWGEGMIHALEILDRARDEGIDTACDFYPYRAGSTQLINVLPKDVQENGLPGLMNALQSPAEREKITEALRHPNDSFENIVELAGWENILVTSVRSEENKKYCGMNMEEIAQRRGQDPYSCAYDMLLEENCEVSMVDFYGSEEDICRVLQYPYSNVISDSTYPDEGILHPRLFGAFARILEKYVREDQKISLAEAVKKMTSMPAGVLGLPGKGRLLAGKDADILVFDLNKIHAGADFITPCVLSKGFYKVIVDGKVQLEDEE